MPWSSGLPPFCATLLSSCNCCPIDALQIYVSIYAAWRLYTAKFFVQTCQGIFYEPIASDLTSHVQTSGQENWACICWSPPASAPKIIVGQLLTKGIHCESASTSTVFPLPTFTLIFNTTFARYCLVNLKTRFVKQHWETGPRSISHILFRSP